MNALKYLHKNKSIPDDHRYIYGKLGELSEKLDGPGAGKLSDLYICSFGKYIEGDGMPSEDELMGYWRSFADIARDSGVDMERSSIERLVTDEDNSFSDATLLFSLLATAAEKPPAKKQLSRVVNFVLEAEHRHIR